MSGNVTNILKIVEIINNSVFFNFSLFQSPVRFDENYERNGHWRILANKITMNDVQEAVRNELSPNDVVRMIRSLSNKHLNLHFDEAASIIIKYLTVGQLDIRDFTDRDMGRIWMRLNTVQFYGDLIPLIVLSDHLLSSVVQITSSLSMMLAHMSNELLTFQDTAPWNTLCLIYETVFQYFVDTGKYILAIPYRLFVNRAILQRVLYFANREYFYDIYAIELMLRVRGSDDVPDMTLDRRIVTGTELNIAIDCARIREFVKHHFSDTLTNRSLQSIIEKDGIGQFPMKLSSAIVRSIHSYVHGVTWRYIEHLNDYYTL